VPILGTITSDARIIMDALRGIREGVRGGGAAMRDAYLQAGRVYMGFIRGRFITASGGGGTWAPLSPFTIADRLRSGFGDTSRQLFSAFNAQHRLASGFGASNHPPASAALPILIRSGRLYGSLQEGGPEHIEEVLPDGIRKGTGVFYAAYHQAGGGRLPQREILVPPDAPTSAVIVRVFIAGLTSSALGRSMPTTALAA
jgi:hypothetical protein